MVADNDASGNVWFDLYSRAVYELDSRALPEKVRLYREIPTGISQENLADFEPQERTRLLMAYDENGRRVHYGFRDGGHDYAEATFPGVGVYHRDGADSPYALERQDLIAGGYRKDDSAYFPVTDVQGSVRGYATSSGVQGAYSYYPYGTAIDLAHHDAEDGRRWQGKEFDSDLNKYYFGARFYDPVFGLWLSPDPANQFANPYTYGGDPLNYIDPNGESVTAAIVVGAIVGAAIGASVSAVNCSGANEVSCGRAMSQGAAVGAVAGAASGGVGSAVGGAVTGLTTAATGSVGLATGSGAMGAIAGGAVEGGISGLAASAASYGINTALTGTDFDWGDFGMAMLLGSTSGALMGGLSSGIRYGVSESYQWQTHETVLNYGDKRTNVVSSEISGELQRNVKLEMAKYVQSIENSSNGVDWAKSQNGVGTSATENNVVRIDWSTGIDEKGYFSASRFYSSIVHENGHLADMSGSLKAAYLRAADLKQKFLFNSLNEQEKIELQNLNILKEKSAIQYEMNHKYNRFWGNETKNYINERNARY